jgi:hypothetical protein
MCHFHHRSSKAHTFVSNNNEATYHCDGIFPFMHSPSFISSEVVFVAIQILIAPTINYLSVDGVGGGTLASNCRAGRSIDIFETIKMNQAQMRTMTEMTGSFCTLHLCALRPLRT